MRLIRGHERPEAEAAITGASVTAADLLPYPVMVVGSDHCVRAVNRAFVRLLGPLDVGATCCSVLGCGGAVNWQGCITDQMLNGKLPPVPETAAVRCGRAHVAASKGAKGSDAVVYRLRPTVAGGGASLPQIEGEPRLRIRTFGATEVRAPSGELLDDDWLDQRPGQLLKYLIVTRGRAVPADEIAEALWPRHGSQGPATVRHAVHLLRRKLEPDRAPSAPSRFIVTRPGRYALDLATVWIDADAFESATRTGMDAIAADRTEGAERSLRHALDLYRGEFLADDVYADWTIEERERLRSLVQIPLRLLAELRLAAGDFEAAAPFAERLGRLEPLDGDVHRLLVGVTLLAGRRSRALRLFEAYRVRLQRELGLAPDFSPGDLLAGGALPLHAV